MGSGVIYYKYEKREKFEDYDMKTDVELGTFKIRRYHFDDESFVHPLHSVRFDPDRPSRSSRRQTPQYSPRGMPTAQHEHSTSSVKGTSSFRYGMASSSLRKPRSWELIPPSKGWMCDGDDEKEIGGMKPSVKKDECSEEDPEEEDPKREEEESEEEEGSEEGIPASPSLPMDIDAEEDYLRYIDELERRPEHSPLRSSQAFVPDVPAEASDRLSDSHNVSSYDLSGVWRTPSSGPSP
ncbi:hypothetical protein PIB30_011239 [Stylosanthes scabra]|uniref:Uncharacterized protein n=1 Tax=Stylosanthes scabra TaxID=79078 RepID=A0ABU6T5K5_9FABA|nr:hypothetical protein [Stylosanthes scabra]